MSKNEMQWWLNVFAPLLCLPYNEIDMHRKGNEKMLVLSSYFSSGDYIAIVICLVNYFILKSSYSPKKKSLRLFYLADILTAVSAANSILYHFALSRKLHNVYVLGSLEMIRCISIAATFTIFCWYLMIVSKMHGERKKWIKRILLGAFLTFLVVQLTGPVTHLGVWFNENGQLYQSYRFTPFQCYYMICGAISIYILCSEKMQFITGTRNCILKVMAVSFGMIIYENITDDVSLVAVSFAVPINVVLSLFHFNPYDKETGTFNRDVFENYIADLVGKEFGMYYLFLRDMTTENKRLLEIHLKHFNEKYFKPARTFRIDQNRFILVYERIKNRNYENQNELLHKDFEELYRKYQLDYKVLYMDSDEQIQTGEEYIGLMKLMEKENSFNQFTRIHGKDIEKYLRVQKVKAILEDIYLKQDLFDERVRVYCQPVLNAQTNQFTTAEALMRIETENGVIYPNEFISLAEQHGFIHVLSKIILNKTCQNIRKIEKEGYCLDRISINISMEELHDTYFCTDIMNIIEKNGVNPKKIAIELTESRNERDYNLVKQVMTNLRIKGIQFYLDDFGTGYSNFERIIGLPFDIIKFDRSLTILASKDEKSRYMVGSFSNIFDKSEYKILFEGVENENDETNCIGMNAKYLQGYKYSKPIPIEQYPQFLHK